MKSILKFQILGAFLNALGYDDIPSVVVEANKRLGKPFFVCKNYFGEGEIMPVPEQRSETFARIMGDRLRYSGGWMAFFDGEFSLHLFFSVFLLEYLYFFLPNIAN